MSLCEQNIFNTLDQINANTNIRVVYASKLNFDSRLQPKLFKKIEASANKYNYEHDISGELYYGNGYFLQCLEGVKDTVITLLKRIYEDKRHKMLKILLVEPIEIQHLKNLTMRLIVLDNRYLSLNESLKTGVLDSFLPFKPHEWSSEYTENFLDVIHKIEMPIYKETNMTTNTLGTMIRIVAERHKVFLLVQGVLTIFFFIALVILFQTPWL